MAWGRGNINTATQATQATVYDSSRALNDLRVRRTSLQTASLGRATNSLVSEAFLPGGLLNNQATDILRDVRRRIHKEDGPAVHLSNGKVLYFWHGVHVPEYVIMRPETITISKILKERNIELRRIFIERYGQGKFLRDIEGEEEARDNFGILWRILRRKFVEKIEQAGTWNNGWTFNELFGPSSQVAKFVEVQDASTPRVYFLQVPPKIKTPKEGIAWTFGRKEEEYEPLFQS